MKHKNIFFIIPHFARSGPTRQLYYLIKELQSQFNIEIYCVLPEKSGSIKSEFEKFNIKINTSNKKNFLKNWIKLVFFNFNSKDKLFHSYGLVPDILSFLLLPKRKWICVARNYPKDDYPDKFGPLKGSFLAMLHLFTHKRCKNLITCSESLSERYNLLEIKNIAIQNSVNISALTEYTKTDFEKKEYLFVGNIRDLKRVDFVCDYYLKVSTKPSILNIVGSGPELKKLKDKYYRHRDIIFHGHSDEVRNFYVKADYFINLSSSEGMPNAVLEALSFGCPCILSAIPSHIELARYIDKGIFIVGEENIDKINELSIKMFESFKNNLPDEFRFKIHEQLSKQFGTERLKKDFISFYNKI
tara:strand:- start:12428 stop:13501 length:1074 start_codon:yes stop_codon:yes gene_type:complete